MSLTSGSDPISRRSISSQNAAPASSRSNSGSDNSRQRAVSVPQTVSSAPPHPDPMIGAPVMFYDPGEAASPREQPDYQQWVANYHHGQPHNFTRSDTQSFPFPQHHPNEHDTASMSIPITPATIPVQQNHFPFAPSVHLPPGPVYTHQQTYEQPQTNHSHFSRTQHRMPVNPHHVPNSHVQELHPGGYEAHSYGTQQSQQTGDYFYSAANTSSELAHAIQPPTLPIPASTFTPTTDAMTLSTSVSPTAWPPADTPTDPSVTSHDLSPTNMNHLSSRPLPQQSRRSINPRRHKRQRPPSDSESEDDEPTTGGVPPLRGPQNLPSRLPGACTHCKRLKMKCFFPEGSNTCKRCAQSGHPCIVEGRKPRNAPNKREYLLLQIRQKDQIIESLLKQLHNPYAATPLSIAAYRTATSPSDHNNSSIVAWLDRMQESIRSAGASGSSEAFKLSSRVRNNESEAESEGEGGNDDPTERGSAGHVDDINVFREDDAKLQALPDVTGPIGLLADLSLENTKRNKKKPAANEDEDTDDDNVGVANETYFMPGPAFDYRIRASLIEKNTPPEILVHNLVTPEDVEKLFEIFYARLNPFIGLLDQAIHTPATTFARCPFLFTVVCAVSSRYYPEKSEIYPIAMHFAKHQAADALINGWKSVELAQAYILMSIYAVPARRWEDDRSWLYTGMAIRLATDLNLHQVSSIVPQNERQARELINRTRVWMICYNLDRSTATQFGKPTTIREDYTVRHSEDWYKHSEYNHPYDIGLNAYTQLLRIMARFHDEIYSDPDSPTGLKKDLDFRTVALVYDDHLTQCFTEWTRRFQEDTDRSDTACAFRADLLPFLTDYSRLVMFSFAFQQAFRRGVQPEDQLLLEKCVQAAKSVITVLTDVLAVSGYMRYSPDGHFIFASFASAFLLKILRPEFSSLIPTNQDHEIFELIGKLIHTLSSPEIAIDDRHTPRLHARFLAGLLSRHRRETGPGSRHQPQQQPPQNQINYNSNAPMYSPPSSSGLNNQSFPSASTGSELHNGLGQTMGHQASAVAEPAIAPVLHAESMYAEDTTYTHAVPSPQSDASFSNTTSEEMLGALLALKNPAWWEDMMMPGFSWGDNERPYDSNASHQMYEEGIPGITPGFTGFQTAVQYG